MRLLALLVLALAIAIPASAQNATENAGANESPPTPTPEATPEPTGSAAPEPITIELEGVAEGGATFFRKPGETARNPRLVVEPGQKVTFVLTIASGVHNLNVNREARSGDPIGVGETATFEWTAPMEPGSITYLCEPHSGTMKGTIQVGTASAPTGGEGEQIDGPTVDLGQYNAACAGKVAPASAANGEVGMPTIQDYIDRLCISSDGEVEVASDPYKSADYVIPLSWALIGLGVVGVVWVHKYYKP